MKNTVHKKDIRVEATFIIWGCATGMMAIYFSLASVPKSGFILPLVIILGASVCTTSIWRIGRQEKRKLVDSLQQIEQRVRDLETIYSSDCFTTASKFQELEREAKER
ncbi:MAG: hypothetical protein AAFQ80_14705 [Cyanobacteria bacterium J06621_8]